MLLKKQVRKLHLWLGLVSGLGVFLVAITGCIYAFQQEIQDLTQPYRFVNEQPGKALLPPSEIRTIADSALPDKHIHAVMYEKGDRAAKAIYYSGPEQYYYFVYINQYTGNVLKVSDEYAGFFRFILDGHFNLWLPRPIGQPLVAILTLMFTVMLISGLVLWWPKRKSERKKRLTIKKGVRWRRRNYDLHNVLGFYAMWLAAIFAITGLVWGFEWFRNSYYSVASGGDSFVEYREPLSDTNSVIVSVNNLPAVDRVWMKMNQEYSNADAIEVHFPETAQSPISANANPDAGTYWKMDYRYFDQYTLEELSVNHIWGRYNEMDNAEKLFRMNYDIHVGAIGGLTGKTIAFFISLIVASLPVTGTIIWYGRRKKKPKKKEDSYSRYEGAVYSSPHA